MGNPSWVVDDDEQLLDVQLSRRPPSYGLGATDHRKNSASRSAATPRSYRNGKVEPRSQQSQPELRLLGRVDGLGGSLETETGGAYATPIYLTLGALPECYSSDQ